MIQCVRGFAAASLLLASVWANNDGAYHPDQTGSELTSARAASPDKEEEQATFRKERRAQYHQYASYYHGGGGGGGGKKSSGGRTTPYDYYNRGRGGGSGKRSSGGGNRGGYYYPDPYYTQPYHPYPRNGGGGGGGKRGGFNYPDPYYSVPYRGGSGGKRGNSRYGKGYDYYAHMASWAAPPIPLNSDTAPIPGTIPRTYHLVAPPHHYPYGGWRNRKLAAAPSPSSSSKTVSPTLSSAAGDVCTAAAECVTVAGCSGGQTVCACFQGQCVTEGTLRFSMAFMGVGDLDLSVVDPNGDIISFDTPGPVASTGTFDAVTGDAVADATNAFYEVESVYFAGTPPSGTYTLRASQDGGFPNDAIVPFFFEAFRDGIGQALFTGVFFAGSHGQTQTHNFVIPDPVGE